MGAKGGSQTTTQGLDPATAAMQQQVYGAAMSAAGLGTPAGFGTGWGQMAQSRNPLLAKLGAQGAAHYPGTPAGAAGPPAGTYGLDPATKQAMEQVGQFASAGQHGLAALNGDAGAFASFMNPYNSGVLDAVHSQFNDARTQAGLDTNDAATRAGAFGGARHGVAEGVRLSELDKAEMAQQAGLTYQGFNDAMARAASSANLGFGASGQLAQMGDYARGVAQQNDPAMMRLRLLQGAMSGTPYGTQTTQPTSRNVGAGVLGGASSGAEIGSAFGPWGTGIGAGIGGLIGLFG